MEQKTEDSEGCHHSCGKGKSILVIVYHNMRDGVIVISDYQILFIVFILKILHWSKRPSDRSWLHCQSIYDYSYNVLVRIPVEYVPTTKQASFSLHFVSNCLYSDCILITSFIWF